MKLIFTILAYLLIAVIIGWGILLLLAGKPWLLIIGALAYLVAVARIGCASH